MPCFFVLNLAGVVAACPLYEAQTPLCQNKHRQIASPRRSPYSMDFWQPRRIVGCSMPCAENLRVRQHSQDTPTCAGWGLEISRFHLFCLLACLLSGIALQYCFSTINSKLCLATENPQYSFHFSHYIYSPHNKATNFKPGPKFDIKFRANATTMSRNGNRHVASRRSFKHNW